MIPFIAGLAIGATFGVFLFGILTSGKIADLEMQVALIDREFRNAEAALDAIEDYARN